MIRSTFILLSVLLFSSMISGAENSEIIDLNGDGIEDITYEYVDDGYFELIDRNFDGKMDESNKYTLDHYLVSSKADDDFDGFSETQFIVENGFIKFTLVDSDYNQMFDIILYHKNGLIFKGERFYKKLTAEGDTKIGEVKFKYGYPLSNEEIISTKITEKQFHSKALNLIQK